MKKVEFKADNPVRFGSLDLEVVDADGDVGNISLMPNRVLEFNLTTGKIQLHVLKKVIEEADKFYEFKENRK